MLKNLMILGLMLGPGVAMASPVLDCTNPATGAQFHLSQYADQPPYFLLNTNLIERLNRHLPLEGSGGKINYGRDLLFTVSLSNQYLSVDSQGNGGWLLTYAGTTFYFNPGECQDRSN